MKNENTRLIKLITILTALIIPLVSYFGYLEFISQKNKSEDSKNRAVSRAYFRYHEAKKNLENEDSYINRKAYDEAFENYQSSGQ